MSTTVMDRIAKLWELAQRAGTEHEAAVASERIAELMAKYQLTQAEVEAHTGRLETPVVEIGRIDDEENGPIGKRLQNWAGMLAVTVAEAFGGRAFIRNGRQRAFTVNMVGPKDSILGARYLFMVLNKEVRRLGHEAARARGESTAWRRAYRVGVVTRISHRLRAARASAIGSSTALVRVDAAVAARFADLNAVKRAQRGMTREDGISVGYRDGDKVDLSDTDRARLEAGKKQLP